MYRYKMDFSLYFGKLKHTIISFVFRKQDCNLIAAASKKLGFNLAYEIKTCNNTKEKTVHLRLETEAIFSLSSEVTSLEESRREQGGCKWKYASSFAH